MCLRVVCLCFTVRDGVWIVCLCVVAFVCGCFCCVIRVCVLFGMCCVMWYGLFLGVLCDVVGFVFGCVVGVCVLVCVSCVCVFCL